MQLKERSLIVAGLGISGYEVALLAASRGAKVTVIDSGNSEILRQRQLELEKLEIEVILNFSSQKTTNINPFDIAVISPGIPTSAEVYTVALGANVVYSELGFAAQLANWPLYGITGTNGKTTTVEMIVHTLKTAGIRVVAAGNIGLPLSRLVRENENWQAVIVEVSSFQLEITQGLKFTAGAILNITTDHEDRYDSFSHYRETKMKMATLIDGNLLLNNDLLQYLPDSCTAKVQTLSEECQSDYYSQGDELIANGCVFDSSKLQVFGCHNVQNSLASIFISSCVGLSFEKSFSAMTSFKAPRHRMERVDCGTDFLVINDSKSTNPDALVQALKSLQNVVKGKVFLIAGGRDKKMDFTIANSAVYSYVTEINLYGEAQEHLFDVWQDRAECFKFNNFETAVTQAFERADCHDCLLLSPACASLDLFSSYVDRGNEFIRIIRKLSSEKKY